MWPRRGRRRSSHRGTGAASPGRAGGGRICRAGAWSGSFLRRAALTVGLRAHHVKHPARLHSPADVFAAKWGNSVSLTVGVLAYNSERMLPDLLASLPGGLAGVADWHLVIVDGASS